MIQPRRRGWSRLLSPTQPKETAEGPGEGPLMRWGLPDWGQGSVACG